MAEHTGEVSSIFYLPPPTDFNHTWVLHDRIVKSLTPPQQLHKPEVNFSEWQGKKLPDPRYYIAEDTAPSGGMGKVHKAWDAQRGEYVAIKTVSDINNPQLIKKLELEAKTAARNPHPNTIAIYNFFIDEEHGPILVMPWDENPTLSEKLKTIDDPKPLTVNDIETITTQVATVIDHLNKTGIVHQDLHPGNISFSQKEQHTKVRDFGLANWVKLKEDKGVGGLAPYVSPERALKEHPTITVQSEVFSLGTILYEMLANERLFNDDSNADVIINIMIFRGFNLAEHPKLRTLFEKEGIDLIEGEKMFKKALAPKPEDRYQTATEFAKAFSQLLQHKKHRNDISF